MKNALLKRTISITLSILMMMAFLPAPTLAEDTAVPAAASPAPSESPSEETSDATPAPAEETPVPAEETPAPAEETTVPAEVTPAPAEETPAPSQSPAEEATDTTPDPAEETPAPEVATYEVNFVINGVTEQSLKQIVEENGLVTRPSDPAVPEDPAFEGQEFLYWFVKADEPYAFSTPVTSNLVLIAKFGATEEPLPEEEPALPEDGMLFSAFSMEGGILPEGTPLWTYTFVVSGITVETKIVADGDTLDEPAIPAAPEGQMFTGWYTESDTLFDAFGVQTVTEDGSTTLTAGFTAASYVFFHNQFGAVIETRLPDATGTVYTNNINTLQLASDEALTGWSLTSSGTTDVGGSVIVDGANIDLYPIIETVVWVTFDSVGGTYVAPMHIAPGAALTQADVDAHILSETGLASIVKAGYIFAGWQGFAFGGVPTADVALTASWTANTNTPYQLVYWTENADDAGYSFEKAVTKTGTSGAVITLASADTAATNLNSSYSAYFNTGTYTSGQTIKGDGSSIVNIYHTRKTYTLRFVNGTTTLFNQTFKYDQSVAHVWDVSSIQNLSNQGYVWKSSLTGAYYTFLMKMPGSNLTMTATLWSGSIYTWDYYLETLDGTAATAPAGSTTTTSGGITYYLYRTSTIKGTGIHLTYDEDYFPITGFYQRDSSVPNFVLTGSVYYASLFYRRASYNLTFINGDTTNTISNIRYEASIEGQYYIPDRPTGVSSTFTFEGWYTTEDAYSGSEFSWPGTIMPAKNLVLYANWAPPIFTGIAYSVSFGSSGGTTVDLGTIEYGGTISAAALASAQAAAEADKPNPTDTFGGWLILKNGSLILFNANLQIYENVVLYPVWISTLSYAVTYDLGEATGTAPTDGNTYAPGSQAEVKAFSAESVTPPADKVFIGWRSSADSKIYYPKSAITILQDTTMTAVWVYSSAYVTITYDGNGGQTSEGETTFTGGAVNNTYHTVQGNSFLYEGKRFIGWNTMADGSGDAYAPGDSVLLGASVAGAPGALYAIWEDMTYLVSVSAVPEAGVVSSSGAGTYVYGADATVTWALTTGYEITSITDNGVPVPAASYAGGSYTISGILEDHDIVLNTQMTLFTLTYDGNGGTADVDESYSMTKTTGTSFTVDENTFARTGYYFLGWSTDSGATAADPAYAPGQSATMPSADLTLYAVWAQKTALTLTSNSATYNYDGSLKSVSGITPSIAGLTIEGTTAGASSIVPGEFPADFSNQAGLVIRSGGEDVTEQYDVSWATGSLTVNPRGGLPR